MARKVINTGAAPNDGTGDNLRVGGGKVNDNFSELYTAFGDGSTLTAGTFITTNSTNTLENKSIDLTDNTLTGTTAEFNTALTDNDFATLAGSEVLTNKTIDASSNTLSNIANSALTNSSVSIIADDSSAQSISLGGSILFTGGSGITTSISGNEITFDTDGSIVTETSSDVLTNKSIDATTNTLSNITNTELSGSAGITNANLANSSIIIRDDSSTTDAISLGETLVVTGGSGIDTAIASNELTLSVSGLTNTNLSGSAGITNANLDNSSITLGATAVSLGATAGSATNFNLSGTSSLSGSGTVDTTGSGNKLRFNVAAADASALGSAIDPTTYEGMFAYNTTENVAYVADTAGWTKLISENDSIGSISNVDISGVADNYMLKWDGVQARFEAVPQKILAAAEIDVTNSGTSAYLFNSHYSGNNPTLYVRAGATYAFNLDVSGHPFHLQTVSGAYSSGNSYTTGLTHIADDGTVTTGASALLKEEGTLYYEIPSGTSGTIYYACQYHSGMAGSITIQSDTTAAGVSFTTDKSNTGDGSTTAFTINAGRDVDDILVIVNGIVLTPTDDYTVSGTTLTFTSAPAASAGIVIRYLG
jgi:plastocyanin